MNYVVGFLFSQDLSKILLMIKNRPPWQAGKLNGPGGKVEDYERPWDAIVREFKEETGLEIPASRWHNFCSFNSNERKDGDGSNRDYMIHFYRASGNEINDARSTTDEQVMIYPTLDAIHQPGLIPELRWLIPMALGSLDNGSGHSYNVVERT